MTQKPKLECESRINQL